jgi:hypothetical protein
MSAMRRSSRWRTARRSDSRSTASDTGLRPAPLIAVPDGDGRLSEGLLVEGRLVARLLGARLLTVDARLVLTPAQLTAPAVRNTRRLRTTAVGAMLAAAERLIDDA